MAGKFEGWFYALLVIGIGLWLNLKALVEWIIGLPKCLWKAMKAVVRKVVR